MAHILNFFIGPFVQITYINHIFSKAVLLQAYFGKHFQQTGTKEEFCISYKHCSKHRSAFKNSKKTQWLFYNKIYHIIYLSTNQICISTTSWLLQCWWFQIECIHWSLLFNIFESMSILYHLSVSINKIRSYFR